MFVSWKQLLQYVVFSHNIAHPAASLLHLHQETEVYFNFQVGYHFISYERYLQLEGESSNA